MFRKKLTFDQSFIELRCCQSWRQTDPPITASRCASYFDAQNFWNCPPKTQLYVSVSPSFCSLPHPLFYTHTAFYFFKTALALKRSRKSKNIYKMLSYRRETALQSALFSPKVEDWNWETIFYGHYRSIFNHCHIIGLKICRIPWKSRIKAITAFKVIQGHRGRYQSKARMRYPISD